MYSFEPWTTTLLFLIFGAILGYIVARFQAKQAFANCRSLQKKLDESEEAYSKYKENVTEHFSHTAQLVNQMTSKYQAVHEHLAKGAGLLCHIEKPITFNPTQDTIESLEQLEANPNHTVHPTIEITENDKPNLHVDETDFPMAGEQTAPKDYQT